MSTPNDAEAAGDDMQALEQFSSLEVDECRHALKTVLPRPGPRPAAADAPPEQDVRIMFFLI